MVDDRAKHRAWIAVKAQALMSRYFQLPQDELVEREILKGWMDTLEPFSREEIETACSRYLIKYPSKRPHEGILYNMIVQRRRDLQPASVAVLEPPRCREAVQDRRKAAAEIMAKFKGR